MIGIPFKVKINSAVRLSGYQMLGNLSIVIDDLHLCLL